MNRAKKLSRAERVQLASSKFELIPQTVETVLDWMVEELRKRDRFDKLSGDKASRKQVRMLRDSALKTLNIAKSDKLPAMLGALFAASEMLGMLNEMHNLCDDILSTKLTPRRDDADGYQKRVAVWAALTLFAEHGRKASHSECQELAAILYGARDAAAVRRSFKGFLKEAPKILGQRLEETKRRVAQLKAEIAAAEAKLARLRGEAKNRG